MEQPINRGGLVIILTFAIAYVLALMPMYEGVRSMRPEWVSLVLIYWCMAIPHRVGVFSGWLAGIILDVVYGALIGQYALALAIIAFLSYKLQNRLQMYPILQQSLIILLLIALSQMIILWIKGVTGSAPHTISYWLPSLSSTLMWPIVYATLSHVRRVFGIV